jgi:hypothetical protein
MLQYVLRERPEAPYAFMSSYLKRKAQELGEKPQAVEALLKSLGIGAIEEGGSDWGSPPKNGYAAPKAAPMPYDSMTEGGDSMDPERIRLEAEHISLRTERSQLLRELAELEAGALEAR